MTFQEALKVIYAPTDTHDSSTINKAISAVKWYANNVLELEDYETGELYKALDHINKNTLEELQ